MWISPIIYHDWIVILSARIYSIHRIVPAVREHVVANDALTGAGKLVRIDEAAGLGIVVTAVQVIQSQLLVKPVTRRPKTGTF